jgi:hypothetical protein
MPAADMEVINFFQEPMAWHRPRSQASSPRGKTNSKNATSARSDGHRDQGLNVTSESRSDVDSEFPPADRLRLSGSVSRPPTRSPSLRRSLSVALASRTTQEIRHSPFSSSAQGSHNHENTFGM